MAQKQSFWAWFWGGHLDEETLRQMWIDAAKCRLKGAKPQKILARLRPVQQYFLEHPAELPNWYMTFLRDFLRTPGLTEHDLKKMESMGDALKSCNKVPYRPEDIWDRMVQEYDARRQPQQALALLKRIYSDPVTDEKKKQQYAQELVRRGAVEDYLRCILSNKQGQLGLLALRVQQRDYDTVIRLAQQLDQPIDPQIADLVQVCQVLRWLDSRDLPGPPSMSAATFAQTLVNLDLYRHMGGIADIAIGQLYLLEGNAQQALNWLQRIVSGQEDQLRGNYYLAWAHALSGDREGVACCLTSAVNWKGHWTVGCLLLEVDPTLAEGRVLAKTTGASLLIVPPAYDSAFQFRLALARATRPPTVQWQAGAGLIEEDLEALRSVLGFAFYTKDKQGMRQAMDLPLFQRLPLADQETWCGLYALCIGDQDRGSALLEKAAITYGCRRAALILSVHMLEQKQIEKARQLLHMAAAGRTDFKVNLLFAHISACERKIDAATKQLEQIAAPDKPRTYYALGNLYLFRADEAESMDLLGQATHYREQAARFFDSALQMNGYTLPVDTEMRTSYAKGAATDNNLQTHHLRQEVKHPRASQRERRLAWKQILAQLWSGEPALTAVACEDLLDLLPQARHLKDTTVTVLAQVVAWTCTQAGETGQAEKMVRLLGYLLNRSNLQVVKRLHQRSVSTLTRLRYMEADEQSRDQAYQQIEQLARAASNFSLILLSVYINMERQDQARAAVILREARPEDAFERDLQACLLQLLIESQPLSDRVPQPQVTVDAAPKLRQACSTLQAAAAFATNRPEQGYEALVSALQGEAKYIVPIIDAHRLITSLCAYYQQQGNVPAHFLETLFNISTYIHDAELAITVVRYLASAGEVDKDCRLWEQALAENYAPDHPLRREFTKFLCYQATQEDYKAGDYLKAAHRLRTAIAAGANSGEISSTKVKHFAEKLELQHAIKRLLGDVTHYTPGRYRFLESVVEQHSTLLDALLSGSNEAVQREWAAILKNPPTDIRFLHGLAVMYWELAFTSLTKQKLSQDPLIISIALWILLLCTPSFWEYFSQARIDPRSGAPQVLNDQQQAELMAASLEHILSLHSSSGSRNFAAGRHQQAGIHLHCLNICRSGANALITALKEQDISYKLPLDEQRVKQATEQAEKLFEDWCEVLTQEALKIVTNPEAIKKLPPGIRQNYEGGIRHLEPFLKLLSEQRISATKVFLTSLELVQQRTDNDRLAISATKVLLTSLEWYNEWCRDLSIKRDATTLSSVAQSAIRVGDQLINLCRKGQEYKPEHQAISLHLTYRALVDVRNARPLLNEAQQWNSHNKLAKEWYEFMVVVEDPLALFGLGLDPQEVRGKPLLHITSIIENKRKEESEQTR